MTHRPPAGLGRRFLRDERGSNAIEFAILAVPFIMLLLFALQIGLYAATKSALDIGVVRSAEAMEGQFGLNVPVPQTGSTLKTAVATNAGGFVINNGALAVEVRSLSGLSGGPTPIVDQYVDPAFSTPHKVFVIRASFVTPTFVPGLNAVLKSYSSALVRRQAQ